MRFLKPLGLSILVFTLSSIVSHAQQDVIQAINNYGTFDKWCSREVKESSLIGGETKKLYEFYGNYGNTFTGKTPYKAPSGYLWRTNNVLAIVAGITKTNNTVFPEKRGNGYCARIETHIEEVKVLGTINMDVVCQGAIMIGALPEPITTTKDPMSKVLYGVPFTGCPKSVQFDYKAEVGNEVIRGTGFSKLQPMGYKDYAEVTFILQKRWEDEEGNIHALRVATGIKRITRSTENWINGYEVKLHYGDISNESFYKEYMGLKTNPTTAYRAVNSKGKVVVIKEEGWAPQGTKPTHMMLHFITSCGRAFYGGVGNTLWLDNVKVIM